MSDGNDAPGVALPARIRLLGEEIRKARLAAGLTQTQLGERACATQSMVSAWEAGFEGMRLETLHTIEVALGLFPGGLFISSGYVRLAHGENDGSTDGWYFG